MHIRLSNDICPKTDFKEGQRQGCKHDDESSVEAEGYYYLAGTDVGRFHVSGFASPILADTSETLRELPKRTMSGLPMWCGNLLFSDSSRIKKNNPAGSACARDQRCGCRRATRRVSLRGNCDRRSNGEVYSLSVSLAMNVAWS